MRPTALFVSFPSSHLFLRFLILAVAVLAGPPGAEDGADGGGGGTLSPFPASRLRPSGTLLVPLCDIMRLMTLCYTCLPNCRCGATTMSVSVVQPLLLLAVCKRSVGENFLSSSPSCRCRAVDQLYCIITDYGQRGIVLPMASGYGLNGGQGRCFPQWQGFLACYGRRHVDAGEVPD